MKPYTSKLETLVRQKHLYVRQLASVPCKTLTKMKERERERERGRKAIVELAATEAANPHQQPSPWHLPAPCDWGIVRQEYAAGGVGCALCSGLPGVLISDCFISSGGGGGVVVFWGKVSRKVFKFKFRTSIFHCKLVSKGLGTYLAHLNQSE
jgi:hypothetical protein